MAAGSFPRRPKTNVFPALTRKVSAVSRLRTSRSPLRAATETMFRSTELTLPASFGSAETESDCVSIWKRPLVDAENSTRPPVRAIVAVVLAAAIWISEPPATSRR